MAPSRRENPAAPRLWEQAVNDRFARSFLPYASGPGQGGVLAEGTQYGPYLAGYATVPFVSAAARYLST